jgi:hypothetical protein
MEQRVVSQLNDISRQVGTVADDVTEIKRDNELLRQSLLGDVEGETPHGRIPKMEADIFNERQERLRIDKRLAELETAHVRYRAYAVVIGVVTGSASGLFTGGALILIKYALEGMKH